MPWSGEGGAHLLTLLNQARHLETCGTQGPAPPWHPREWSPRGCPLIHSHPFPQNVWLWLPTKPGWLPSCGTNKACVPRGPSSSCKELIDPRHWSGVDLWLSLFSGVTLVASGPARGGGRGSSIVSPFEDIIPLGPGTPSTFKAPLSQPPPPSLHQHAGSGCPNTRGLFSLHAQGGGLGASGPHTLAGPGRREAGLPHPVSPDRLCPPSYSHHCPPPASVTVT